MGGGGVGGGGGGGWGRGRFGGGCERRIEVFCEHSKNNFLGGRVGGIRVDVNEELKFLGKFKKKNLGGGGGGGLGVGLGGQGGCERRIEVFVKNKKNGGGGSVGGSGGGVGIRGSFCENSKKKKIGGWGAGRGGGGVRVDVNEELKFLGTFQKKMEGGGRGSGWVGGSGWM